MRWFSWSTWSTDWQATGWFTWLTDDWLIYLVNWLTDDRLIYPTDKRLADWPSQLTHRQLANWLAVTCTDGSVTKDESWWEFIARQGATTGREDSAACTVSTCSLTTTVEEFHIIKCVIRSHEMRLNLKFGKLRCLHVSNLQVLLVILIFTAVARKRPRSTESAGGRSQLNTHTPYVCGFAWSDMVHGCVVYTERAETAAASRGTSCVSALSTPLRWMFKKRAIKS